MNTKFRQHRTELQVGLCGRLGLLGTIRTLELGDLLIRFFLGDAVKLLNLANELVTVAFDNRPIVVGELTPFYFDLALGLLPIAGDLVPIHVNSPS